VGERGGMLYHWTNIPPTASEPRRAVPRLWLLVSANPTGEIAQRKKYVAGGF